jgi:hypothetical protein
MKNRGGKQRIRYGDGRAHGADLTWVQQRRPSSPSAVPEMRQQHIEMAQIYQHGQRTEK